MIIIDQQECYCLVVETRIIFRFYQDQISLLSSSHCRIVSPIDYYYYLRNPLIIESLTSASILLITTRTFSTDYDCLYIPIRISLSPSLLINLYYHYPSLYQYLYQHSHSHSHSHLISSLIRYLHLYVYVCLFGLGYYFMNLVGLFYASTLNSY